MTVMRAIAAMLLAGLLLAPPAVARADGVDFALGKNSEGQACRAVARFDTARGEQAADVYCGAWERPSGRLSVLTGPAAAQAETKVCEGPRTPLASPEFQSLVQVACVRGKDEAASYALIAKRGASTAVGQAYPADWPGLVQAARVLTSAAKKTAVAPSAGETPGLRQIAAVFPEGAPGQSASVRYELLRRRAYEYNASWSFATSTRDFQELLAAHRAIAPDDVIGEAEVLAEVGLNLSGARRFDEAGQALGQAKARAIAAGDKVLATKIENYRAMDALDRRDYARALQIVTAANAQRAELGLGLARGDQISAAEARRLEGGVQSGRRSLLVSIGAAAPADRLTILSAQGDYIAGAALRGLDRPGEAQKALEAGVALLEGTGARQQGLVANLMNEEAQVRIASGDSAGAAAAAAGALRTLQTVVPGTSNEALLWLTLSQAQAGAGRTAEALASGRRGVALYAQQLETPGMPPEVAAPFLDLLLTESARTSSPALAAEYFETLALVWDGAASRSAAQLAARLVLSQGGAQARAYQDAERTYRAVVARREVASGPGGSPQSVAAAEAAVEAAQAALRKAEGALRQSAPAYLELLNPRVKTADLSAVLQEGEGYLRVVVSDRSAYAALVDRGGAHPYRIPLGREELNALVERLRASTRLSRRALPDFDLAAAHDLDQAILAPIDDPLAKLSSLQVDVSGALAAFPLSALVDALPTGDALAKVQDNQDYTGVAWVARRLQVNNTLGPATFVRLRNTRRPTAGATLTAAVYGDFRPQPGPVALRLAAEHALSDVCREEVRRALDLLTALPDTADEARAVATAIGSGARLRLGGDFTDADVLKSPQAGDADVMLLATHGVLGLSSCFAEPALLTSLSPTDPSSAGLIEASQLLDRKLQARLVVLSACDTAGGAGADAAKTGMADGGEALSGLARGFIYAGAANVMATEWKVDSASSAAEIASMLKVASSEGSTVGQALAKAQAGLYADPEHAHPFYWAAFILIGDGAVRLSAPPAKTVSVASAVAQPPAP